MATTTLYYTGSATSEDTSSTTGYFTARWGYRTTPTGTVTSHNEGYDSTGINEVAVVTFWEASTWNLTSGWYIAGEFIVMDDNSWSEVSTGWLNNSDDPFGTDATSIAGSQAVNVSGGLSSGSFELSWTNPSIGSFTYTERGGGAATGSATDNIRVSETVTMRIPEHHKSASDTVTIHDTADADVVSSEPAAIEREVTDTVAVVDTLQVRPTIVRSVTDTVTAAETVALLYTSLISVIDTATLADTVICLPPPSPVVLETVTVSDTAVVRLNLVPAASDTVTISDTVTVQLGPVAKSVTDTVTVQDVATASTGDVAKQAQDTLTVNDTVTVRVPEHNLSVSDAVTVQDTADCDVPAGPVAAIEINIAPDNPTYMVGGVRVV